MEAKKFKITKIRAAVIGSALMAANSAILAAPVNTSLEFTCPFPLIGDQTIIANINADYESVYIIPLGETEVELPQVTVEAIPVVPERARQGLYFVNATTITGVATSINNFHTVAGVISNDTALDIEPTWIPNGADGPFDVPASGVSPAQVFDLSHVGEVSLTIDDLIMDLQNLQDDGSLAPDPIGSFIADCALNPGQNNVLTTFEVRPMIAPPTIGVEPETIDFGSHLLGQTVIENVRIENAGGQILGINSLNITGLEEASAFAQTSNCTTLSAGESCTAVVTYSASAEGAQTASLVINSTDAETPRKSIELKGVGEIDNGAVIKVAVTELDFGTLYLEDEGSQSKEILIENVGTAPLVVSVIATNTQGSEFSVTENCSEIAAGAACSETVTFDAIEGDSAGVVNIYSNDIKNDSVKVKLLGSGGVDFCLIYPDIQDCGWVPLVNLGVEGSTYIAASQGTVPLTGLIESQFNLTGGTFTGDLHLDSTQGSFEIIQGWRRYQATAQIEFEPVGGVTGTLVNGVMTATLQAYVKLPKVTKSLFGLFNWKIGGGDECRTKEPVIFTIATAEGDYFEALSGGVVSGSYTMPELENCGLLTSILSSKLAGPDNIMSLTITPEL
jgi:hypothetical protein